MDIARFRKLPLIGILRGIEISDISPLMEAVADSGLKAVEITMNTKGASRLIKKAAAYAKNGLVVGAGTVVSMDLLDAALEAGATFIVMPTLVRDVVRSCVNSKVPVFPGAFTPQEISDAWGSGATMVKVFPSGFFGPAYLKEIKGPFDNIELMACGGVTPENMKDYFSCGASAAAFGASVFKKEWLAAKDYSSIRFRITEYVMAWRSFGMKA